MGNSKSKIKISENSVIGKADVCPLCNQEFDKNTTFVQMKSHLNECSYLITIGKSETDRSSNEIQSKFIKYQAFHSVGKYPYNSLNLLNPNSNLPFESKIDLLKSHIKKVKIDWREGCCNLHLSRQKILEESIKQFNNINIFKELKINFKGEVTHDAGGIIREWFTIIFKELQSPSINLFSKSENDDFSYIINPNIKLNRMNLEIFNFFGKILAKSLLENITINTCLNKIFYKIMLNEKISFDDLVFIDKTLYHSLENLKKIDDFDELGLFFIVNYKKGNVTFTEEIITDGANIGVTKENLDLYIDQRIQFMVKKDITIYNEMRNGFFSVLPEESISFLNSDEFELIINGQPFIDVSDWRMNTNYQGTYTPNHYIIEWFWLILETFSQDELARFLQFCTGTSRVPIQGFQVLESNRGEISKFCIVSTEYIQKSPNFIRAHTCFNRIDLPKFPNRKLLEQSMNFILKNDVIGFGID